MDLILGIIPSPTLVVSHERQSFLSNSYDILGLSEQGMKNIEEADSRIVLHIMSFLKSGLSHVTVETYDTDVLIIVMSYLDSLRTGCADLNIEVKFGDRLFDITTPLLN